MFAKNSQEKIATNIPLPLNPEFESFPEAPVFFTTPSPLAVKKNIQIGGAGFPRLASFFYPAQTTTVAHLEPKMSPTLAFWRSRLAQTTTVAHLEPKICPTLAFWRFRLAKTTTVAHLD